MQEQLKEPFETFLNIQNQSIEAAIAQTEEHKDTLINWSSRKSRFTNKIIKSMRMWSTALKRMARPFRNWNKYKNKKKQMMMSRYPAFFSRAGFNLRALVVLLQVLNLIRITIILAFYGGFLLAILLLIGKITHIIK